MAAPSGPSATPTPSTMASTPASAGFVGNEAVAGFRIRVGRQIGNALLLADG